MIEVNNLLFFDFHNKDFTNNYKPLKEHRLTTNKFLSHHNFIVPSISDKLYSNNCLRLETVVLL